MKPNSSLVIKVVWTGALGFSFHGTRLVDPVPENDGINQTVADVDLTLQNVLLNILSLFVSRTST